MPDQYALMESNVQIESIEFKTDCNVCPYLSSVRVNLSNGQSSPVFENSKWPHHSNHERINFDPKTKISAVFGFETDDEIGKIMFIDSMGNTAHEYNPTGMRNDTKKLTLREGEELIGFYGFSGGTTYIRSFGFIVKKK